MAIYIDEMKNLQLYNRDIYAPINKSNKLKGMASILVTSGYQSMVDMLLNDKLIMNSYKSYYTEKNINFLINNQNQLIDESYIENETDDSILNEVANKSGKLVFPVRSTKDKNSNLVIMNTHPLNISIGYFKTSMLFGIYDYIVSRSLKFVSSFQAIYLALAAITMINQFNAIDIIAMDDNAESHKGDEKLSNSYYIYKSNVLACDDGEVVFIQDNMNDNFNRGFLNKTVDYTLLGKMTGNCIVIKHDDNRYSLYGHLLKNSLKVKVGDKVKAGDIIALVGNSGNSSEPHLHFEYTVFSPKPRTMGLRTSISQKLKSFEDHKYIPLGDRENTTINNFIDLILTDLDSFKAKFKNKKWETNRSGEINHFCIAKFPDRLPITESVILEDKLKASERTDFGVPSKKKYPMPDASHVLAAIRMFNHVDPEDEKTLASNIKKKIKQYGLKPNVGKENRFSKYYHESNTESILSPINKLGEDEVYQNESFIATNDRLYVLSEANDYSNTFKRLLYSKRFKNNKEVLNHYDKVKEDLPFIDNTYLDLSMYKGLNLFIDFSYYSEEFYKKNYLKKDKGLNLLFAFLDRFIQDPRLAKNGYPNKTVIIDIDHWQIAENSKVYDYNKNINPISMIYRYIRTNNQALSKYWNNIDFLFLGKNGSFKVRMEDLSKNNINRFISNIDRLYEAPIVDINANTESDDAKVTAAIDKIEKNSNIKINNLTGSGRALSSEELAMKLHDAESTSDVNKKKEVLVDYIKQKAASGEDVEQSNDKELKRLIADLTVSKNDTGIDYSVTRVKRMSGLNDAFLNKKADEAHTVKDLIEESKINKKIPKTDLPIDSIDDEWNDMTFINFSKSYDMRGDIYTILYGLSEKSVPISVRNIEVEDISTSEDYLDLYKIELEDVYGKRFKLNIEMPKFIDNRYMRLRGNDKILSGQLMLLPVIKTDEDTVQVVSNYNKIFIRRYGTTTGKSFIMVDRMIKAIKKAEQDKSVGIKAVHRNNTRVCSKYELPIDYIDMAGEFDTIENQDVIFYFNQDVIRKKYNISKDEIRIPIGYSKRSKRVIFASDPYYFDVYNYFFLGNNKLLAYYDNTTESSKYTYSQASILNTKIPLIVVMAYSEGLQTAMTKANIEFEILDKRERFNHDQYGIIKFNDGYIKYKQDLNSSLLMNGLKECNTEEYSITQMNDKAMWVDFLDIFGSKIIADGLDNFYDLMIDPMTRQACMEYQLPTDYVSILAYANNLLVDNKYNRHVDIRGNRLRTNEVVAGYFYKVISKAYGDYQRQLKRNKKDATMSCKRSAVIDAILMDPTESDASALNPILDLEAANTVTFKGLSGMNNDRSYGLDKRTYDKSMNGIVAMSTGFAGNVGITRWATLNANVEGERGYIKQQVSPDEMTDTNTLCATEAMTPFGVTSDDPFRMAMTFIQTSKHGMRIAKGCPMLVTDGMDEAIAYMTRDTFSFKAKGNGRVKEITDEYMILEYDPPKGSKSKPTYEFVDLTERVLKNSDGGFFITVKLDACMKKGQKIKPGSIVAYDKLSYSNEVGDPDHIAYSIGAMSKIAILPTDEGYEDSAIIDSDLSEMMASDIVVKKEVLLSKNTNVYNMLKPGTRIEEGDPLIIFQNAYDQEDANQLLKTLSADEDEISELGRISLKAKVTGFVQDVKLYRTVELNELSPSLRKIFTEYEKRIKKTKSVMEKYHIDTKRFDSDYKLDTTGKLKNSEDGVLIEFYLSYHDKMSVGDKLIYYAALKGVVKGIFPKGKEPYTDYRPNEKIHSFLTASSVNKRMVASIIKVGSIQKILIEMDRKIKDLYGIEWDDNL